MKVIATPFAPLFGGPKFMPFPLASARRVGSSDRVRLMLFSIATLCLVSFSSAVVTAYQFRFATINVADAAATAESQGPADVLTRSALLAAAETLALVIAGGTLLVRVCNPFIRRLEESEARLRGQMLHLQEVSESLEAKATQLAKTNRELDDFTFVASHDLKEPLRGISSYCQILLEDYSDKLDADGQRRLQALVGLCQRLGRLIDDLLTYSQIGRTQSEPMAVDLNEVVADVLGTLGPAIDQRGGAVHVKRGLPKLSVDRVWVGEVFRNLVTNAMKFNDHPRPTVAIGCLDGEVLYVRDNGIGIPACHHEAIFAMFRRLHSRQQYEGTGAGLTFVRKIVEAHGGHVWVKSQPGCGSTFYFTLSPGCNHVHQEPAACAVG